MKKWKIVRVVLSHEKKKLPDLSSSWLVTRYARLNFSTWLRWIEDTFHLYSWLLPRKSDSWRRSERLPVMLVVERKTSCMHTACTRRIRFAFGQECWFYLTETTRYPFISLTRFHISSLFFLFLFIILSCLASKDARIDGPVFFQR